MSSRRGTLRDHVPRFCSGIYRKVTEVWCSLLCFKMTDCLISFRQRGTHLVSYLGLLRNYPIDFLEMFIVTDYLRPF